MLHGFYRIKRMLHSRMMIFWTLAFPIFLGAMFYFMFGNFDDVVKFKEVSVGVIHYEENEDFMEILESVEVEDGKSMFKVSKYENEEDAKKALQEESIYGIIDVENELTLVVKKSSIYNSLIKTFLDQYKQNVALIENVAKNQPDRIASVVNNLFSTDALEVQNIELKGKDKKPETQYFYALIAMCALMAAMMGMYMCVDIQADSSIVGARRNVAPTSKMKQVLTDFLASYLVYCVICLMIVAFCIFVYKQDFGTNVGLIILTACIGSFCGMAVGILIGTFVKGTAQKKEGLCTTFFMVSSFLAGLQAASIPYMLEKSCPIVNRINPATLIVNAFQSLAVFGDYKQYTINLITLLVIGLICVFISVMKLRRGKYASI